MMVHSGQTEARRVIEATLARRRYAGSYLVHGASEVGQTEVARFFARGILCIDQRNSDSEDTPRPCERCHDCELSRTNRHPDLMVLTPEHDGAGNPIIRIDTVRAMQQTVVVHPTRTKHRVVIIEEAQSVQTETAHSLLKTLEEPPAFAVIILTTSNREKVLPTIQSRTQKIRVATARRDEIEQSLIHEGIEQQQARWAARLAQGQPQIARVVLEDSYRQLRDSACEMLASAVQQGEASVLKTTESFKSRPQARELVLVWQGLLRDVVLARASAPSQLVINQDVLPNLRRALRSVPTYQLVQCWEALFDVEERLAANANVRLVLDDWLVRLIESVNPVTS